MSGTTASIAAWGRDTAGITRAVAGAGDSLARLDSMPLHQPWRAALDSARALARRRTGRNVSRDTIAPGYALDRAALALAGVADSALLDFGGQFLWVGPADRPTARAVGIPDPKNSLDLLAAVEMQGGSVSTAVRRGEPSRSVTVLAPDGLTAAAWSRAFLALPCDSAVAVAAQTTRWRMGVVCADSAGVYWTPDLEHRIRLPRGRGRTPEATGVGPGQPAARAP